MMSANWWVEGGSLVTVIMIFFNAEGAEKIYLVISAIWVVGRAMVATIASVVI